MDFDSADAAHQMYSCCPNDVRRSYRNSTLGEHDLRRFRHAATVSWGEGLNHPLGDRSRGTPAQTNTSDDLAPRAS